jgi:hypothetical protein
VTVVENQSKITIVHPSASSRVNEFVFSNVFDERSNYTDIYDRIVKPIVSELIDSNGEATFYFHGSSAQGGYRSWFGTQAKPGLVRLVCEHVIEKGPKFARLFASPYEIMGSSFFDLIETKKLMFSDIPDVGITVQGISKHEINNIDDLDTLENLKDYTVTKMSLPEGMYPKILSLSYELEENTIMRIHFVQLPIESSAEMGPWNDIVFNKSTKFRESKFVQFFEHSFTAYSGNTVIFFNINQNSKEYKNSLTTLKYVLFAPNW